MSSNWHLLYNFLSDAYTFLFFFCLQSCDVTIGWYYYGLHDLVHLCHSYSFWFVSRDEHMMMANYQTSDIIVPDLWKVHKLTDNFSSRPTSLWSVSLLAQDHGNHAMVQKYYKLMFHLIQSTNLFPLNCESLPFWILLPCLGFHLDL